VLLRTSITTAFDDGRTQLLLCVHGLLPISFRQASYHIPVAIWFIREYPRQPPIVYVVPTNDMLVKAGKYIDVSGRCTLEYMTLWKRKSEVRSAPSPRGTTSVDFVQELQPLSALGSNARTILARTSRIRKTNADTVTER